MFAGAELVDLFDLVAHTPDMPEMAEMAEMAESAPTKGQLAQNEGVFHRLTICCLNCDLPGVTDVLRTIACSDCPTHDTPATP